MGERWHTSKHSYRWYNTDVSGQLHAPAAVFPVKKP